MRANRLIAPAQVFEIAVCVGLGRDLLRELRDGERRHAQTLPIRCGFVKSHIADKSPDMRGLRSMRRRGLEPPPGYPGPGPQPGASTNSAIGAGAGGV